MIVNVVACHKSEPRDRGRTRRLLTTMLARAFLLSVLLATTAYAAPAPFAKPVRTKEDKQHPTVLCGPWMLHWYGQPYHYHLHKDGTYTHHPKPAHVADYSGTWKVHKFVLIITEHHNRSVTPLMTHKMHYDGTKWVYPSRHELYNYCTLSR
jgi:hypothetical protein